MRKLVIAVALGAASLGVAACGDRGGDAARNEAADTAGTAGGVESVGADGGNAAGTTAATTFPKGARIVEENGVTWRIDADGTRVRLGENDSRIVVENGVRYRVDPGGARVKIDAKGIDLTPDIDLPDVDIGINDKGNPDIDVKDKKDGNKGPD